jgi:hypothetical protein
LPRSFDTNAFSAIAGRAGRRANTVARKWCLKATSN